MAVIHRSHVHPSANHQLPAKSQALRAVVIPADYKHRHAAISQAGEESIKYLDRLGRRHRLVVHIACNQHSLRLFLAYDGQYLIQYIFLVLQHGKFIYPFSYVQV